MSSSQKHRSGHRSGRKTTRSRQKRRVDQLARRSVGAIIVVVMILAGLVLWAYYRQASLHEGHDHTIARQKQSH